MEVQHDAVAGGTQTLREGAVLSYAYTQTNTTRIRERNSGQPCEGSCAGALRVEQMGRGKVTEKSRNSTDPEFQTPGGCVSGRGVCSCGEPCWCDGGSHECMNAG